MNGIETTLVIILGIGYALLLLLSIIVVYVIVRILQNIHHITEKAEATTNNISETVIAIGKKLAPGAASALVGMAIKRFKKKRAKQREEDL